MPRKTLFWISQYYVSLVLLGIASIGLFGIAAYLFVDETILPFLWYHRALRAVFRFHEGLPLQITTACLTVFTSMHLYCVAWMRTPRSRTNWAYIGFLTLLAAYLPFLWTDLWFSRSYESTQLLGKQTSLATSTQSYELDVFYAPPDKDTVGIYTYPFASLFPGQILTHENWDFSIRILAKLEYASIGGPLSKVSPEHADKSRIFTATQGLADTDGLKLFQLPSPKSGGSGLKVEIRRPNPNRIALPSYILFGSEQPDNSLPLQPILPYSSSYSIALLPTRNYLNFAWSVRHNARLQTLECVDPRSGKTLRTFTLDQTHNPSYKGYTFSLQEPSPEDYINGRVHLSIRYSPVPPLLRQIPLILASMLLVFLLARFLQIMNQHNQGEEGVA